MGNRDQHATCGKSVWKTPISLWSQHHPCCFLLSCILGHYISSLYWFTMRYPSVFFPHGCYFSSFSANTTRRLYPKRFLHKIYDSRSIPSLLFFQYPNGPNVEPLPLAHNMGIVSSLNNIINFPWLGFLPKTWVTNHLILGICSSQLLMTGILLMGKYNPPHYWELMSLLP